mgnify:FL=1
MSTDPTIDDSDRKVVNADGESFMLDILDIRGHYYVDCGAMEALFARNAQRFFFVFDVTSRESCNELQNQILPEILSARGVTLSLSPVVLVGNKADLESERRVAPAEGKSFAEAHGWQYFDASAKMKMNVEKSFVTLAQAIRKDIQPEQQQAHHQKKRCCIM